MASFIFGSSRMASFILGDNSRRTIFILGGVSRNYILGSRRASFILGDSRMPG